MIQKKWNESKSSQYVAKFVHLFVFSMCSGYYCYITKHSNYSILFFSKTLGQEFQTGSTSQFLLEISQVIAVKWKRSHLKARLDWISKWLSAGNELGLQEAVPTRDLFIWVGPPYSVGASGSWTSCTVAQGSSTSVRRTRQNWVIFSDLALEVTVESLLPHSIVWLKVSQSQACLGTRWENKERNVK